MVRLLASMFVLIVASLGAQALPGGFNPDFNAGSPVLTQFSPSDSSSTKAMAIQPDGRIVMAGTSYVSTTPYSSVGSLALARYNRDGSLDASFGAGGKVTVQVPGDSVSLGGLALLPDGKLLVTESLSSYGPIYPYCRIARYTASGTLDASFGSGGILEIDRVNVSWGPAFCVSAGPMAVDSSGRILLIAELQSDYYLLRLTPTGAVDTTFNGTGTVYLGPASFSIVSIFNSVVILSDGRIVLGGYQSIGGVGLRINSLKVTRLLDDGSFDPSFGGSGVVIANVSVQADGTLGPQDYNFAIAAQPGGEIVVAGSASPSISEGGQLLVARFTSTGLLDTTFNGTGFAITALGSESSAYDVAIQANGKIIATGRANIDGKDQIATVRFLANGTLDSSFGSGGVVTLPFAGNAAGQAICLDEGGGIFIGGYAASSLSGALFALVGLEGDDTTPPDTFFTSAPASIIAGPDAAYSFSAIDVGGSGVAGFDCGLDGAGFVPCASPATLTGLPEGSHTFRVRARDKAGNVEQAPAAHTVQVTPLASIPRVANISTRGQVDTGFGVMIGGFVVGGLTGSKTVMVRAVGPSLAKYGVEGALANPKLQLVRQDDHMVVAENDDWIASPDAAAIDASGLVPANILEAAILATVTPGSYTAIVTGIDNTSGIGLVEVYEVDHPDVPLVNISTRGKVMTGFGVMIGGFILQGSGPQTVVIRGIGPSLADYGVEGALSDPTLQLVRMSDGQTIAFNNDWRTAINAGELQASGFAPSNPLESAILITLDPGAYTAIMSGLNGATGVGLVEVYKVGQ
jgi:uncharacterized delta-60 repeat protein